MRTERKTKPSGAKQVWEWVKALGIALVVALLIRHFLITPIIVDGESMEPELHNGDRLIANRIGYTINGVERFDIIIFEATEEKDYIKRVIGLPGDHIESRDDQLYINGEPVDEPYLNEELEAFANMEDNLTFDFELEQLTGSAVVPDGHYFVLGDNRRYSEDSRSSRIGFVASEDVIGKVGILFWPLSDFRIF